MSRRLLATLSTAAAVTLALTACGSDASTSSSTASGGAGGEKVTLKYWTHVNPPSQAVEKELIQQYEATHPNVTIDYLTVDFGSLATKLNTAITGGTGPDLFNIFQSYEQGFVAKNLLAEVDTGAFGVDGTGGLNQIFSPSAVAGYTVGGKVYGIPHETSSFVFWVNGAAFKKAGLDPVKDFPKTWADVAATGQKVQSSGGAKSGLVRSLYNPIRETLVLDTLAKQAGGALFSADGKTAQLNSPPVVKALQSWGDLVHQQKVINPSLGPTSSTLAESLFQDGTAAMTDIGGSWLIPNLLKGSPEVAKSYQPGQYPTYGGEQVGGDLYGFGLFVPANAKHQKEAWAFARFLVDHGQDYFDKAGVWLGDQKTLNAPATNASPHWDVFKTAFSRGTFLAPVTKYDQLSQIVERAVQRVVLQDQSAQQALDQAQAEAQPLMG